MCKIPRLLATARKLVAASRPPASRKQARDVIEFVIQNNQKTIASSTPKLTKRRILCASRLR